MQRKKELFEMAAEYGVKIINAKSSKDSSQVAIHLLNPDLDALEMAIFDADSKMFPAVVIHSRQTWPYSTDKEKAEVEDSLLA